MELSVMEGKTVMTKTEETMRVIDHINKVLSKGMIAQKDLILPILCDIATSLAIIADKVGLPK